MVPQAKLVRCVIGEIYDVVVDLRKSSETYKQWFGIKLSEENKKMMFVPKGFAHGFLTLSDHAIFHYKCDELYMATTDAGINFRDEDLKIDWGIDTNLIITSEKDRILPKLSEIEKELKF
jgi:dTDP-4-dehydrorhamnose 3,5-epimerase